MSLKNDWLNKQLQYFGVLFNIDIPPGILWSTLKVIRYIYVNSDIYTTLWHTV